VIAYLVIGWIVTIVVTAWVTHRLCQVDLPVDLPAETPDSSDFLENYDATPLPPFEDTP